jgi:hypothetical protein
MIKNQTKACLRSNPRFLVSYPEYLLTPLPRIATDLSLHCAALQNVAFVVTHAVMNCAVPTLSCIAAHVYNVAPPKSLHAPTAMACDGVHFVLVPHSCWLDAFLHHAVHCLAPQYNQKTYDAAGSLFCLLCQVVWGFASHHS